MNIRTATQHDALELKVLVESLAHFYLEGVNAVLPDWLLNTLTIEAFDIRLVSTEFSHFVYVEDDNIIGYVAIKDESHLYHLFVAEGFHGKGIAKQLWNHVVVKTNANVYTVRSSIHAVPVYKRFGFQESEPVASKEGIGFQSMTLKLDRITP